MMMIISYTNDDYHIATKQNIDDDVDNDIGCEIPLFRGSFSRLTFKSGGDPVYSRSDVTQWLSDWLTDWRDDYFQ